MNVLLTPSRLKRVFFTFICPTFYGGPPSQPSETTSTVTQNSIPAELMPYATGMLAAAKNQLYTFDKAGNISGFQPYKPYSANGKDYVAPFSSLQTKSQILANGLQTPGQYKGATNLSTTAGMNALTYGKQANRAGNQADYMGGQAARAGADFARQAVDSKATAAYMSPYMQNVVNRQKQEAIRDFGISGAQQMGQATQQGAFGGSREAIMAAENERNMQWKLADIQATGTQNAFQDARSQQQFGANLGLEGIGQSINAYGTAANAYGTGVQAAGTASNAGATLGNIGTSQLQAQQGIVGTLGAVGATQQAQNQKAIDQAVLNYQNAQQQPYTALGTMSALIRGTPTGNLTTQQYQTQPSTLTQVGGALGTIGSLYGASQAGKASGGIVGYSVGGAVEADLYDMTPAQLQEVIQTASSDTIRSMAKRILAEKSMANGGIVGFANGGYLDKDYGITDTAEAGLRALHDFPENYLKVNKRIVNRGISAVKKAKEYVQAAENKERDMKLPKAKEVDDRDYVSELGPKIYDLMHPAPEDKPEDTPAATAPTGIAAAPSLPVAPDTTLNTPVNAVQVDSGSTIESPSTAWEMSAVGSPDQKELARKYIEANSGPTGAYTQWANTPEGRKALAGGLARIPDSTIALGRGGPGLPSVNQEVTTEAPTAQDDASIPEPPPERDLSVYQQQLQEAYAREGIKNPDDNADEYRKRIMQQGLDLRTSSERDTYLRMAEFFSHWGATPGPPLVAGMKALTQTMPSYLEDKKEQAKLSRVLDESLYKLEAATRLEKLGDVKGAFALKNEASDHAMKVWDLQVKASENKKARDSQIEQAKIYAAVRSAGAPNSMLAKRGIITTAQIKTLEGQIKQQKIDMANISLTDEQKKPMQKVLDQMQRNLAARVTELDRIKLEMGGEQIQTQVNNTGEGMGEGMDGESAAPNRLDQYEVLR